MMYPVLAKVRYDELGRLRGERGLFVSSLWLNWVFGPLLMFTLAWLFLADQPAYRTGVIIVGLARCIAMVLVWNDLACGDREGAAVLVALNSLFQIVAYSFLGYFYLTLLPSWLGLDTQGFEVSIWEVARTVLIFLGIPLLAGYLTQRVGVKRRGRDWYESTFLPRISPITLYGLLFTIVLLFAIQGDAITASPFDVARIALPLLIYFLDHVRRLVRAGEEDRARVRPHDGARVHRRQQQLRARDRRLGRRFRRDLRPGARRRRRATDRSARTRRARLRGALVAPAVEMAVGCFAWRVRYHRRLTFVVGRRVRLRRAAAKAALFFSSSQMSRLKKLTSTIALKDSTVAMRRPDAITAISPNRSPAARSAHHIAVDHGLRVALEDGKDRVAEVALLRDLDSRALDLDPVSVRTRAPRALRVRAPRRSGSRRAQSDSRPSRGRA